MSDFGLGFRSQATDGLKSTRTRQKRGFLVLIDYPNAMAESKKLTSLITAIERIIETRGPELHLAEQGIITDLEQALFDAKGMRKASKDEYDLYEPYDDGVLYCKKLLAQIREFQRSKPNKYPEEMYKQFWEWWSEPDEKGQPRWWTTKYDTRNKSGRFHIPGRLSTWRKRYKPTRQEPVVIPQSDLPNRHKMRKI